MTTFEHAMVGISGALAGGLHRRHGWQITAMAGVAAVLPDWDGLFLVASRAVWLVEGHRVWGHNLLVAVLVGAAFGALDYRVDLVTRCGREVSRLLRLRPAAGALDVRRHFTTAGLWLWVTVGIVAALSHLAADLLISGTASLPHWKLQLLWPFSSRGWVFPLVQWGDPAISIIFAAGMLAMVRWRSRLQTVAQLTLACVVGYFCLHWLLAG